MMSLRFCVCTKLPVVIGASSKTPTKSTTQNREKWSTKVLSRHPQLIPFINRLGHDGNRPEDLKYSVLVPNAPGSNYGNSFTVLDFSTSTLLRNCRHSGQVIRLRILWTHNLTV